MDPPPPAVRLPPARGERDHQAAAAHQASAAPSAAAAAAAAAPAAAADHPAAAAAAAYPTPRQQQPQQTTQRQQQQQQTTRRLQSTQRSSAQRSSGSSSTSSSSTSSRPPEARLAFVHPLWPQVNVPSLQDICILQYAFQRWLRFEKNACFNMSLKRGVAGEPVGQVPSCARLRSFATACNARCWACQATGAPCAPAHPAVAAGDPTKSLCCGGSGWSGWMIARSYLCVCVFRITEFLHKDGWLMQVSCEQSPKYLSGMERMAWALVCHFMLRCIVLLVKNKHLRYPKVI